MILWTKAHVALWTALKKVRATRLSKYYSSLVVVVPLASAGQHFLLTKYEIIIHSPTNSFVLYFSALSFFLGSALFDLTCPTSIRDHESRFSFVEDWVLHTERITASLEKIDGQIAGILQKLIVKIETISASDPQKALERALSDAHMSLQSQLQLKKGIQSLDDIWSENNEKAFAARCCIQLLYAVSAVLAAYITFYDAPLQVLRSLLAEP